MKLLADITCVALKLVDTLKNGSQEGVLQPLDVLVKSPDKNRKAPIL
jgi:hypothetical protein